MHSRGSLVTATGLEDDLDLGGGAGSRLTAGQVCGVAEDGVIRCASGCDAVDEGISWDRTTSKDLGVDAGWVGREESVREDGIQGY